MKEETEFDRVAASLPEDSRSIDIDLASFNNPKIPLNNYLDKIKDDLSLDELADKFLKKLLLS